MNDQLLPPARDLPAGHHEVRRAHLIGEMTRTPVPRRRLRLAVGGLGLTAAAAAAVVGISSTTAPTPVHNRPAIPLSGQQILLAAASTAETRPVGSGIYWHVKTVQEGSDNTRRVVDQWTRRDGQQWGGTGDRIVKSDGPPQDTFQVAFTKVDFAQLQKLPTTPTALNAWIAGSIKHSKAGQVPAGAGDTYVPGALIPLLYELPAPPKVRAAAFRLLASLPGVRSSGTVKGAVDIPGNGIKLVIDPKTSLVRTVSITTSKVDKTLTIAVLAAEWTNRLPKVTPTRPVPPGRG
jgi:hypothetical protein